MSNVKSLTKSNTLKQTILWVIAGGVIFGMGFLGVIGAFVISRTSLGQALSQSFAWLFAANTPRITWYITRSAGWIAYFLLWFSTVWGLVLPIKPFGKWLSSTFSFDFHEFLSLLAIGFVALHVAVLMLDQFLPYTLAQILVPFLSPYRPLWVGMGVLGLYLMLLVTVTFYLRKRIGQKKFKAIHLLSLVSYLGVTLHSFFSGTDSSLRIAQFVYLGTFLVVAFLTSYWLILARLNLGEKAKSSASRQVV